MEFWSNLRRILREKDGALPDIELNGLSRDEVVLGYDLIRNASNRISSKDPSYWSIPNNKDISIKFEDNPAKDVVQGKAEGFHLCFDGVQSPSGKIMPELGVFVFNDSLNIDYRMGEGWTDEAIEGLLDILYALFQNCKNMKLSHKGNMFDPDGSIFEESWIAYISSRKKT